jgi:hypothetical protein
MHLVTLEVGLREVGSVSFCGIPLTRPNGGVRLQVGKDGKPVPFGYYCTCSVKVGDDVIREIADRISSGHALGQVGEIQWRL